MIHKGVLLDTSFFIRLLDKNDPLHNNAKEYYKYFLDYLNGSPIRQDYLETVIDWISKGNIESYMATHQHDPQKNTKNFYLCTISSN
jgi:predicted nucleic acid-binding protein